MILNEQSIFSKIRIQLLSDTSMKLLSFQSVKISSMRFLYAFVVFLSLYIINSLNNLIFIFVKLIVDIIENETIA